MSLHFKNQTVRPHPRNPGDGAVNTCGGSQHIWGPSTQTSPAVCPEGSNRPVPARYTSGVQRFSFTQVHRNSPQVMAEGLQTALLAGTLQSLKKLISELPPGLPWSDETKQRADADAPDTILGAVRGPGVTPVNALNPPPPPSSPPLPSRHRACVQKSLSLHVCRSGVRARGRAGKHYGPLRATSPGFFLVAIQPGCPRHLDGSLLTTHR